MPFWDDDNFGSGWTQPTAEAAKANTPIPVKPSPQEMIEAWNANRGDPAKIHDLMQKNGVGVNEAAKLLGVDNDSMAQYLNTGRVGTPIKQDYGEEPRYSYNYDEIHPEAQTREEFNTEVAKHKNAIGADGKFMGPASGVHYSVEGLTPDEVWNQFQGSRAPIVDPSDEWMGHVTTAGVRVSPGYSGIGANRGGNRVDLGWEPGPDNGGGFFAGVGRAIGNLGTGVAHNPALMAALTAGIGSYLTPATVAGDAATAAEIGGNTTKAALYGNAGYGADPTLLQSAMSSPLAKPLMNAGKTLAGGGNLNDSLKSALGSYVGDQASGIIGGGSLGKIGGSVASSFVTGANPLKALVTSGASAAASEITGNVDGFSDLSPTQQNMINGVVSNALQGKNPTRALITQVTNLAANQVAQTKPSIKTSGWSA